MHNLYFWEGFGLYFVRVGRVLGCFQSGFGRERQKIPGNTN